MLTRSLSLKNLFLNKVGIFCLMALCLLIPNSPAEGLIILSTVEKPEVGYYKEYLERFYKWYNAKYFNFDKKFLPIEKKMVQLLIDEINKSRNLIDDRTEMPRIRWGLESNEKVVSYGNLFISIAEDSKEQSEMLGLVLKAQRLPLEPVHKGTSLYGIEWAYNKDQVSVFYINKDHYTLTQVIFKNKKKIDQALWTKLEAIDDKIQNIWEPGTSEVWDVISKLRKQKYVVTTQFPSKKFGEQLRDPMRNFLKEFYLSPQAILIENDNNLKIYYQ